MSETPMMPSAGQAVQIIMDTVRALPAESESLTNAHNRFLAEDIVCDCDYPAFNKATMDGYAARSEDFRNGKAEPAVVGHIAAGAPFSVEVGRGQAARINTGAEVPPGCDCVVMVERSALSSDGRSVTLTDSPRPGRNVAARGSSARQGEIALPKGTRMGPAQIAVAATVGAASVKVHRAPHVAVLTTGDELVDISDKPRGSQIRNSNQHTLLALVKECGARSQICPPAKDDIEGLCSSIAAGLQSDVLCISGGVSMGTLDLVPAALEKLGVRVLVKGVRVKPGKPLIFGVTGDGKLVFALPGNPVSVFVCFHLFVLPALTVLAGGRWAAPALLSARLAGTLPPAGDRSTYHPARIGIDAEGGLTAARVPYEGSGDVFGLARANGFIVAQPGAPALNDSARAPVMVLRWDSMNVC